MTDVAGYFASRCKIAGVRYVFGVPGSFVMPLWQKFHEDPRVILSRHESGAGYTADGYSRASGELAIVLVTMGPGVANVVAGVANAYRDSIPMIVVSGQAPPATFGTGAFLESFNIDRSTSPEKLLSSVTKASFEITAVSQAKFLIDSAFALACSGRPGPVHLSIPLDIQSTVLDLADSPYRCPDVLKAAPSSAAAIEVAERLDRAERPLLILGWGAVLGGARHAASELANYGRIPIVTTVKGLTIVDESFSTFLGHVGPGQRPDIGDILNAYDADVVVIVGASLSSFYMGPLKTTLTEAFTVRVDIDADQLLLRAEPDLAIHADSKEFLTALAKFVGPGASADSDGVVRNTRNSAELANSAIADTHGGLVSMGWAVLELLNAAPPGTEIVPDAGNHWLDVLALAHQPLRRIRLYANCGLGSMGWGIAGAVGIALANRGEDRLTICVTGDGSALMHGSELGVGHELNLDLLVVLFNNSSHGRVRIGQRQDFDGNVVATDLPATDFSSWARSYGMQAESVTSPAQFLDALKRAQSIEGTRLIEVICDPDEYPIPMNGWLSK